MLNAGGTAKPWWKWLSEVSVSQLPMLARVLWQTHRLMNPEAYLREAFVSS